MSKQREEDPGEGSCLESGLEGGHGVDSPVPTSGHLDTKPLMTFDLLGGLNNSHYVHVLAKLPSCPLVPLPCLAGKEGAGLDTGTFFFHAIITQRCVSKSGRWGPLGEQSGQKGMPVTRRAAVSTGDPKRD